VPLPLLAAQLEQPRELRLGLHALARDADAQRLGERGDGAHDRLVDRLRVDGAQERLVDLQLVDRKQAQVGEARVAGAEIVDREAHAEAADAPQRLEVPGEVRHQHALGDLELDARAVDAVVAQRVLQPLEVGVALRELSGRDV